MKVCDARVFGSVAEHHVRVLAPMMQIRVRNLTVP